MNKVFVNKKNFELENFQKIPRCGNIMEIRNKIETKEKSVRIPMKYHKLKFQSIETISFPNVRQ